MINFKCVLPDKQAELEIRNAHQRTSTEAGPVLSAWNSYFIKIEGNSITMTDSRSLFCSWEAPLMSFEDALNLIKQHIPQRTFDIKPFDRVLAKLDDDDVWEAAHYSHISKGYFRASVAIWEMLIRYEGNEELVGQATNPKDGYWTVENGEPKWINS